MKRSAPVRHHAAMLGLALLAALPAAAGPQTGLPPLRNVSPSRKAAACRQMQAAYGKLPLAFEPNRGQADPNIRFLARGSGYSLFLAAGQAVLALSKHTPSPRFTASTAKAQEPPQALLQMQLLGSNAEAVACGQCLLPGKANYLLGNDPARWHTNVPLYQSVRFAG
ncbi:MAG TPA: hypothetical protein VKT32_15980, partial [Chthonomonadaceae bacterium]|nr:hypothetical protein [Chthonomonadaceae bacterium]